MTKKATEKQREKIGVGIIGGGGIAQAVHIPAYLQLSNVAFIAVADPVAATCETMRENFGITQLYEDYCELLNREDVHVISVTTPNFLHAKATINALNAGKHVLCEKPLAMNATEGAQMVEAARRNNRKLMCGYNHRFRPNVQTLKKFAESGTFGKMYYARAQALRRRGIPGWGLFISKEKNGGGPLIDIGVHILDTALHILGFPKAVSVSGKTYQEFGKRGDVVGLSGRWDYRNFTVEDFAVAQVRFEDGLTLTLESSFCANIEPQELLTLQILGDKGGCELNPLRMFSEEHETLLDITPRYLPENVASHALQIASFVDSVINDKPVYTPGDEALQVTRIINAIYESSEKGREIIL